MTGGVHCSCRIGDCHVSEEVLGTVDVRNMTDVSGDMNVDIGTSMGRSSVGDGELENVVLAFDGFPRGTCTNV